MPDDDRIVRASELGQYSFCSKAWWLGSVEGVPSANVREMDLGTSSHERHGRTVQLSVWLQGAGIACLIVSLLVFVLFFLLR